MTKKTIPRFCSAFLLFLLFGVEPFAQAQTLRPVVGELLPENELFVPVQDSLSKADAELSVRAYSKHSNKLWLLTQGQSLTGYALFSNGQMQLNRLTLQGEFATGYRFTQNKRYNNTGQNEFINPFYSGINLAGTETTQYSRLAASALYRLNPRWALTGSVNYNPSTSYGSADPKMLNKISDGGGAIGFRYSSGDWHISASGGLVFNREDVSYKNISQLHLTPKYLFSGFGYYQSNANENVNRLFSDFGYLGSVDAGYRNSELEVSCHAGWGLRHTEITDLESYHKPRGIVSAGLLNISFNGSYKISEVTVGIANRFSQIKSAAKQYITVDSFQISGGNIWSKAFILTSNTIFNSEIRSTESRLFLYRKQTPGSVLLFNLETVRYSSNRISDDHISVFNLIPSVTLQHTLVARNVQIPVDITFGSTYNRQADLQLASVSDATKRLDLLPQNMLSYLSAEYSFVTLGMQYVYRLPKGTNLFFKSKISGSRYRKIDLDGRNLAFSLSLGMFL